MFTSLEEKLEVILENNPSGILKGHIAALDKREIMHHSGGTSGHVSSSGFYSGSYSGRSELRTYVSSFSLETEKGTILIKLNQKAVVPLHPGTEVWVAGTRISEDRFEAEMVILPALQQVLDMKKQNIGQRLTPLLIPIIMALVGLVMQVTDPSTTYWGITIHTLQYYIGFALMMLSVTVGMFTLYCIFKKHARPKTTKFETWEFIKSRFA